MSRDSNERPDPFHVLLSELMLQQTQVATAIPYFLKFRERFSSVRELAQAQDQEVLRLWQGMGYYRRARHLLACAQAIVRDHNGAIPADVQALLALPGIGRYTAGAIASLAFDQRAPILDGNVTRVLCRLDLVRDDPRAGKTVKRLWARAEALLPHRGVGDFNSGLMELGATICTPRQPACDQCPVRKHCEAVARGMQDRVPHPRPKRPLPLLRRWVLCIEKQEKFLVERRPENGRWAGLWQFITLDADEGSLDPALLESRIGVRVSAPAALGVIRHALTHRRYEFTALRCRLRGRPAAGQTWVTLQDLDRLPLPKPHVEIARLLANRANG